MEPGNVNSHIQMPRFLLARFENTQHKFFYYNIQKGFIGTDGHAKSMNTEHGYYPNEIEKFLSDEIEQPFSQILKFIDSLDLDTPSFNMTNMDWEKIKKFMISLIIRGPLFLDSMNNSSVYFQFCSPSDQHTIAISEGIAEAQKRKYFDDYHVTLTINKTAKPFILPICGIYNYGINGYKHICLPVSPQIAITMIEPAGISLIEKQGITNLYLIKEEKHAILLNGIAFRQQCQQHYGYVISPSKDALEELLPLRKELI